MAAKAYKRYRRDHRLIHDLERVKDGSNNHHINTLLMRYVTRIYYYERGAMPLSVVLACEQDMRRTLVRERISKTLPGLLASVRRVRRSKITAKRIIESIFGLFKSKK